MGETGSGGHPAISLAGFALSIQGWNQGGDNVNDLPDINVLFSRTGMGEWMQSRSAGKLRVGKNRAGGGFCQGMYSTGQLLAEVWLFPRNPERDKKEHSGQSGTRDSLTAARYFLTGLSSPPTFVAQHLGSLEWAEKFDQPGKSSSGDRDGKSETVDGCTHRPLLVRSMTSFTAGQCVVRDELSPGAPGCWLIGVMRGTAELPRPSASTDFVNTTSLGPEESPTYSPEGLDELNPLEL
ncbi:hypothetical protein B0I37DRAFT_404006 [Chaetomium sp. MPI-CAGE-AT-0009]|nr:hypothetical protein B0I37DRAFT_404006 [Chaetomium sp. MPI-CAGE-AT-0009]